MVHIQMLHNTTFKIISTKYLKSNKKKNGNNCFPVFHKLI